MLQIRVRTVKHSFLVIYTQYKTSNTIIIDFIQFGEKLFTFSLEVFLVAKGLQNGHLTCRRKENFLQLEQLNKFQIAQKKRLSDKR